MEGFLEVINNPLLIAPIVSWLLAQIIKTLIFTGVYKKFQVERLVGGGGMPSSHSATVCALATACLMRFGPSSAEFAISVIFAVVTMYDAMGVRRETGRQGEVLNDMIELFKTMGSDVGPDKALKELIGHSPLQVLMGAILGIVITLFMYNVGIIF